MSSLCCLFTTIGDLGGRCDIRKLRTLLIKQYSSMKLLSKTYLVKMKKNKTTFCLSESAFPVTPSENHIFCSIKKLRGKMSGSDFF